MALEPHPARARASLEDEAATWLARQRSGQWTADDEASFVAWLRRSPSHAEAWAEFLETWERLEVARNDPSVIALRESARAWAAQHAEPRRRWRVVAAIAASVAVVGVTWWFLNVGRDDARGPGARDPDFASIRDEATGVGERAVIVLADGSRLTLNTATAIHARFSRVERRVVLKRGEVFLEVAKDPERPFIVAAGARSVVAVGTAFAVRLHDGETRVTLVEGRVRVDAGDGAEGRGRAPARPVLLSPGSALIADADGTERVQRVDAERATSWRSGRLIFENERLAEVVAEINRYSSEQIEIGSPALADRRISGVFDTTGGQIFVRALETYGVAQAVPKPPTGWVLLQPIVR